MRAIKILEDTLNADQQVHTVTIGNPSKMDIAKESMYTLGHITTGGVQINDNTLNIAVTVFVVDKMETTTEGKNNEADVLNSTLAVCVRMVKTIISFGDEITIIEGINCTEIENEKNSVVGWECSFTLEVPNTELSIC